MTARRRYPAAVRFEKWHGIGNAYLVIEEHDLPVEPTAARVARICHPDLGAGGDGILLISADPERPRVRIFNPDGGEAEFSGNGTRIASACRHSTGRLVPIAFAWSSIAWLRSVATMTAPGGRIDASARVTTPVPAAISRIRKGERDATRAARSDA